MSPYSLHLVDGETKKMKKAFNHKRGCRVKFHKNSPGGQEISCLLNHRQIKHYNAAPDGIVPLNFKHSDLHLNHEGGVSHLFLFLKKKFFLKISLS